MTHDDAIAALSRFGYVGPSADFLLAVLWHSGWFLRRQYRQATDTRAGGNDDRFLSRLLSADAKRFPYAGREGVYHIHAKRLYEHVGLPNSRYVRPVSETLRAERLMTLDYVLTHPHQHYVVGEEDRVQLFLGAYGIPLADLPHLTYASKRQAKSVTLRFFVEKFPIFLTPGAATVSFVFPQVAYTPYPHAFETFLARYAALLRRLPACEIVYVHAGPLDPTSAIRAFRRFVRPARDELIATLHRYFTMRRQLDLPTAQPPAVAELQQFQRDAARAQAVGADSWYARWLVGGRPALSELAAMVAETDRSTLDHMAFRTARMPHEYPRLGLRAEPAPRKASGKSR